MPTRKIASVLPAARNIATVSLADMPCVCQADDGPTLSQFAADKFGNAVATRLLLNGRHALPSARLRPGDTVEFLDDCRRRQLLGAAAAAVAALAEPPQASADWESTRQARLQVMDERDAAKTALCTGRLAIDKPDLSPFDMTFDPPCYISGYYELFVAAAILGTLKLGQEMDDGKQASTDGSLKDVGANADAPEASATANERGGKERERDDGTEAT